MLKIAIGADLHFREEGLADIRRGWSGLIGRCITEKVDYLLIAGDVFHRHNIAGRNASVGTVCHAFKVELMRFVDQGGRVFIIPGNHDIAGPNQMDALVAVESKEIPVIRTPQHVCLFDKSGKYEAWVQFLPWMADTKGLTKDELIPQFDDNLFKILLGHCEVEGTKVKDDYSVFGEPFMFEKEDFKGKGYDYIALGHIHKRMDNYIGAPWQLSHSDEGYETGFVILEIEDRKLLRERWIELTDTPRYFTYTGVDDITGIQGKHREIDHVKVKYEGCPPKGADDRPANVKLEKVPVPSVKRARSEISIDWSTGRMFEEWLRVNNVEKGVEELMGFVDSDALSGYQSTLAAGSIQRITNISIKHLGPHVDTDVCLKDDRFIAISGDIGTGKTFFTEAIIAAFFGEFPWYAGPIYKNIPKGHEGDAVVSVEFESNGKTYIAERTTNHREKHVAFLKEKGAEGIIAGPKVTDFAREIEKLVGTKKLVLSSVFSSQSSECDIADALPSERQEILREFLGINGLLKIGKKAGERATALKAQIEAAKKQISELKAKGPEAEIEKATKHIAEQRKAHDEQNNKLKGCRKKLEVVEANIKELNDKMTQGRINREMMGRLFDEIGALANDIRDTETKMAFYKGAVAQEDELSKKLVEVDAAKKEYEKARTAEEQKLVILKQLLSIDNGIITQEQNISTVKQQLRFKADNILNRISDNNKARIDRLANIDKEISTWKGKSGLLEYAGCKDSPLPCSFISDAAKAPLQISSCFTQKEDMAAHHRDMFFDYASEVAVVKEVIDRNGYAMEAREKLGNLERSRVEIRDKNKDVLSASHNGDINRLKAIIDSEEGLRAKYQKAQTGKAVLGECSDKLCSLKKALEVKLAEKARVEGLCKDGKELEERHVKLVEEREAFIVRVEGVHKELTNLSSGMAVDESNISHHRDSIERLKALEVEVVEGASDVVNYLLVARAFGKDGIPQLLLDAAIPQIQDILNELLVYLDNRFAITLSTQGETRTGGFKEGFYILVSDEKGERDITRYSGGERKLLMAINRIALAIFQSQRAGSTYEVFLVDEAFDGLDRDSAVTMLRILHRLSDMFNQVFVVSHADDLLQEFPTRISLRKVEGVCEVTRRN